MKKLFVLMLAVSMMFGLFSISAYAVDGQFEWVLPCEWNYISKFSEGYAIIRDYSAFYYQVGNYGYVDRFGKIHMMPDGHYPSIFEDDIAKVVITKYDEKTANSVFINKNFEIIENFNHSEEYLKKSDEKTKTQVTVPGFSKPVEFYEEYGTVNGKMHPDDRLSDYYVIDKAGNPIVRLYNPDKVDFKKEYVFNEDNSLIFINYNNYRVKALKFGQDPAILDGVHFELGSNFEKYSPEALIAYKEFPKAGEEHHLVKKYGAFDSDFNLIIPFEYDMLGNRNSKPYIENNIINAKKDGKWGYIDLNNNIVIDFQFDDAYGFSEGRASVAIDNYFGIIRLSNDGKLYSHVKTPINTATAVKVNINGNEENAYKIDEKIYVPIDLLKNYGFDVYTSNAGKRIDLMRRKIKTNEKQPVNFEEKDSYIVYEPEAYVHIDRYAYPSALIEDTIAVEFDSLLKYGTIWEQSGIKNIAIASPYLPNEGITWEFFEYKEETVNPVEQEYVSKEPEYPLLKIEGRIHRGSGNFNSWGTLKYYDENDNMVLDDNWTEADLFLNGTALVNKGGSLRQGGMYGGKWGLIDTKGNYLVDFIWQDRPYRTDDGYIVFSKIIEIDGISTNQKWAANSQGRELSDAEYRQFRLDHYGKYYFFEDNVLKGVIDIDNQIVLPLMFIKMDVNWKSTGDNLNKYCTINFGYDYPSQTIRFFDKTVLRGGIFVNNEKVEFDTPPLIVNDRTIIPIRAVFEKMGCVVEWISDDSTAIITLGDTRVEIKQGTNHIIKNGEYIHSDTSSINYDDRIHVPLRVISEAFGCNVAYDDTTGDITITRP